MSKKVFISRTSLIETYPEGTTFLQAAMEAVNEAGWEPWSMAKFPSSPISSLEECEKQIRQCGAFVGILGLDWGAEPDDRPGDSFCKCEFEIASALIGQTTVLFLIDDKTTSFPANVIARIPEIERQKQEMFRAGHGLHAKRALTPGILKQEILLALRNFRHPVEPLDQVIHRFEDYITAKDYDSAWRYFQGHLNDRLDFKESRHSEHLRLLCKLFPNGIGNDPALNDANDRAAALNALARSYKNVGQPGKAIAIFEREQAQTPNTSHSVKGIANYLNVLRLTGHYSKALRSAHDMVDKAAALNDPKWKGYSLYWNGVLLAGFGFTEDAVLLFRQSQILFDSIADKSEKAAALARTYAHLAQLELWMENPQVALCYARHARRYNKDFEQPRERIFALRLSGTAKIRLGQFDDGRRELERAVSEAERCEYCEEWIAATLARAELDHRTCSALAGSTLLDVGLREKAESGPYPMLLADLDIAVSQALHRKSASRDHAVDAAKKALSAAVGDNPDWEYHWGCALARKLLFELEQKQADKTLIPSRLTNVSLAGILRLSEAEKRKAAIRAEFSRFLRNVTGHYRYAPAKFFRLIREDWPAIRSIILDFDFKAAITEDFPRPQFVEIHVGHPCNLNCVYCRGKLREKPDDETFLEMPHIADVVKEIYRLNHSAFIRFSGLIGEPLLHDGLIGIFEMLGKKHEMRWGLTTNGIRLEGAWLNAVLKAKHVHVSVDAGSNETYRKLKGGPERTFDKVINNIGELAKMRCESGSKTEIVVSFLLQAENYRELPELARILKETKVDSLEIKMQHFDARRHMSNEQVDEVYQIISRIQRDLSDEEFHVVVVQTQPQALEKTSFDAQPIRFERCYANYLGLSSTVDPTGDVQMCCQYYQRTLGAVGNIKEKTFSEIWNGRQRQSVLKRNPCGHCINCSPSDDFVNRFVQFLRDACREDESFLDWIEQEVKPLIDTSADE